MIHDQTSTKPHLAGFIKWLSPLSWVLAMCGQYFDIFKWNMGSNEKHIKDWDDLGWGRILYSEFSGYNWEGKGTNESLEKYPVRNIMKLWFHLPEGIAGGFITYWLPWWLRWWSVCLQCGRLGFDPWVGKFPGEGNGNPLQYSCLENPMDGGAWCPWGRKELDTTERLHFHFPVFLPGESHGQRSLAGYSPWGDKELDMTEWLTLSFKLETLWGQELDLIHYP